MSQSTSACVADNVDQNKSINRSIFEHPSKFYESFQQNGTKYLKSIKRIPEYLQKQLNACAGEIFLSSIPAETRAEQIAEIASLLGEIYVLRFKVNFSGDSRGFAYLQYMNPTLMRMALKRLPMLFYQHFLPMIRVRESRNSSKLILKKTYSMAPQTVFTILKQVIKFHKLISYEIFPGYFEYLIIFNCNEEAVHARRELLREIRKFGRNAIVIWDTSNQNHMYLKKPIVRPNNIVINPTLNNNNNNAALQANYSIAQNNINDVQLCYNNYPTITNPPYITRGNHYING